MPSDKSELKNKVLPSSPVPGLGKKERKNCFFYWKISNSLATSTSNKIYFSIKQTVVFCLCRRYRHEGTNFIIFLWHMLIAPPQVARSWEALNLPFLRRTLLWFLYPIITLLQMFQPTSSGWKNCQRGGGLNSKPEPSQQTHHQMLQHGHRCLSAPCWHKQPVSFLVWYKHIP